MPAMPLGSHDSPCVALCGGNVVGSEHGAQRTETAVCGGNAVGFAADRAFRPGWIGKQEKESAP